MVNWFQRKFELVELAEINKSKPYQVDMAFIGYDTDNGKFVLLTASGCSCWRGECEETFYESIEELESDLLFGDENGDDIILYQPSLNGAKELIAEARETLDNLVE